MRNIILVVLIALCLFGLLAIANAAGVFESRNANAATGPKSAWATVRPGPTPRTTSGIVEGGGEALPDVDVANYWQGKVGGKPVQAYAGALKAEPTTGVVVLLGGGLNGRFAAPNTGRLRVLQEAGGNLTLCSPAGRVYVFSLKARRFVGLAPLPPTPTVAGYP